MGGQPFTDDYLRSLSGGKYSGWASGMSEETLTALIWALGEVGIRIRTSEVEARRKGGRSYVSVNIECQGSCERVRVALETVLGIATGDRAAAREFFARMREAIQQGPIAES